MSPRGAAVVPEPTGTERRRLPALGRERPRVPGLVLAVLLLFTAFCTAYELRVTAIPSLRGSVFDGIGPDVAMACVGLLLIMRSRAERAWGLIGLGTLCWAAGDIYWTVHLSKLASPPVPSWADAGYLSFCPLAFAGIVLLLRRRTSRAPATLLTDAAAAALAVGGLSAAIVIRPILIHANGGTAATATNLAYPLVDLALLGVIVGAVALSGWRVDRTWLLLGLGVMAFWVADSLYLIADAKGTYMVGDWFNPLWYMAPGLFAWAAWLPQPATVRRRAPAEDKRSIVLPLAFGCVAVGTLAWSSPSTAETPALVLSTASVLVVFFRLALTWREHGRLLVAARTEALTDPLTGLPNRRALIRELDRRLAGDPVPHFLVALFDLDGFKQYNDQFGHLAGDALLARLARKLRSHLQGAGTAYRMGGDEFCALIDEPHVMSSCAAAAAAALSEQGEGFSITCSYGSVVVPDEERTSELALRRADHRMYAQKRDSSRAAPRRSEDVMARIIAEGDTRLGEPGMDLADLAETIALAGGATQAEIRDIRQAVRLHDIGKVAIPDAVLDKPGQLSDIEWALLRSHPVVGERILDAAPGLRQVAKIVRSSHERFDGSGYPDALAGRRIPLGSRIIAVLDAYQAMTSDRAYRAARSRDEAMTELRRCAGTQFDPDLVERFCRAVAESSQACSDVRVSAS